MTAACARVGANAPNGGEVESLAAAMPEGRADGVTKLLAQTRDRVKFNSHCASNQFVARDPDF